MRGASRSILWLYNSEREEAGKSSAKRIPGAWHQAAKEWQWRDRAALWDRFVWREQDELWEARRIDLRDRQWLLSIALLEKASTLLEIKSDSETVKDVAAIVQKGCALARQAAQLQDDLNAALLTVDRFGYEVRQPNLPSLVDEEDEIPY
ncbi:hypothetical protein ACQ4M4_25755 [Leptolyngbya sp. AN02str]|uniref:hypothetical protein n=1 Tax=Leptolyngbya sp. AN02str TaxID=3423363 RepID=UPI003D31B2DD